MVDEILNNPDLVKYLSTFSPGQIIFLEGDDSQELYVLVSGEVEVIKGKKKIREITKPGSIFGEMSSILENKRTATVKAKDHVEAIRIPKEEVDSFFERFPALSEERLRVLAKRLDDTSQILYGLKEFCDQLPDAVILTDKEGTILAWNSAAEKLYGKTSDQISSNSVQEVYEDHQAYQKLVEELKSGFHVREKALKIVHPEKGVRFISVSATALYDGHHNFQGVLCLGRDVTSVETLERSYRRARRWLIPSFLIVLLLIAGIFFGYPYFSKGYWIKDTKKQELRNQIGKDYLLLKALLMEPFIAEDRSRTNKLIRDFFEMQKAGAFPYEGLVLLDKDKKVFDAYSGKPGEDITTMVGSSYAGIQFRGREDSLHKVLTTYRADKDHPMGQKGIEIAFQIIKDGHLFGWIVFQGDEGVLEHEFGIDEEDLEKFSFKRP